MHTADLQAALEVAKKIVADTTRDLTDMRVYPKTPEYDLGVRRVNLVAGFLDPGITKTLSMGDVATYITL